ncbi:hypothetical protein [Croceiramulus getboli]|nr:hypothetical protein P8624_08105 [Flavobacteriaceae bacterium YJPT1-3]
MHHFKTLGLICLLFVPSLSMAQEGCACCTANHQAFDFWVGEWQVMGPENKLAGTNSITKEQDGCVLKEHWTSINGAYSGTSYNFYNAQTEQWEQLWIDNNGGFLKLSGQRIGDQMIMRSAAQEDATGVPVVNRITWTRNDDGSVRQLWELLKGEEQPQVLFDGLYLKKT